MRLSPTRLAVSDSNSAAGNLSGRLALHDAGNGVELD